MVRPRLVLKLVAMLFPIALIATGCMLQSTETGNQAMNDQDRFAWQLFVDINQPIPDDAEG